MSKIPYRPPYEPEFRREAVELVRTGGKTIREGGPSAADLLGRLQPGEPELELVRHRVTSVRRIGTHASSGTEAAPATLAASGRQPNAPS